ncbi:MAG: RluA family pseudouridine synthase [Treponema sp.]|nr:RluA family pseudouridine synthase [Treponema sp.]
MDFKDFTAGENDNNRRIDKIIRIFVKDLPLSTIYSGLRKGLIKVNHKRIKQDYHVCTGDVISIADFLIDSTKNGQNSDANKTENSNNFAEKQNSMFISKSINNLPEIVFKNDDIIIFNKPPFLPVHGKDSLEEIVHEYYKQNSKDNSLAFKPGPLHRIDRNTSGLIAFSWSIKGAQWFCENIKTHIIGKIYLGIVEGILENTEEWTDFIEKKDDQGNSSKHFFTVDCTSEQENEFSNKKIAKTVAKPLCTGKIKNIPATLVEFNIQTGRQHQIRSQSAHHSHPLFGDTAYGGQKNPLTGNYYLHAYKMLFPNENPLNLPKEISTSIPDYFPIKPQ